MKICEIGKITFIITQKNDDKIKKNDKKPYLIVTEHVEAVVTTSMSCAKNNADFVTYWIISYL